jgi:hypothetical protein
LATGAVFDRTGVTGFATEAIPGWDQPFVHTPEDVLSGGLAPSGTAIVVEELAYGAVVAEVLATRGASVELVGRSPMLVHQLVGNQRPLKIRRLRDLGVRLSPSTWVREIGDHQVTLYEVGGSDDRIVDDVGTIVLVTGQWPRNHLATELRSMGADVRVIGDAAHPRRMSDATREGHRVAWAL